MPTTSEAIQIALAHQQAGRLAEAEQIYRQVLAVEPRHAGASHLLGLVFVQSRRFALAIDQISQAIRFDGGQAAYHANLGEAYRAVGKIPEAANCYRQALRLKPDLPEAHNNLGTLLQVQGQRDEALASYSAAIAARPDYADAHNNLGTLYQDLRRWDDALAAFRRAAELAPADPRAFFNLGHALHLLGREEDARAALEQALSLNPRFVDARYALGMVWQALKRDELAEAEYRQALQEAPQFPQPAVNLGTLAQSRGLFDEAICWYQRAIEISPKFAEAHYNWGTALVALNRPADAIERYQQAIACRGDFADAHYNLGTVLQELGRLDEAAAAYQRAIELKSGYTSALNNLGNVYHQLGRSEEAIRCFESALATYPEHAAALTNLGTVIQDQGSLTGSVELLERAVRSQPDCAEALSNLGNALMLCGQRRRAEDCFRRSLELRPDFPEAHLNLGMLLLIEERFEEGWPEYAWRLQCKRLAARTFNQPSWQGEDLSGKTLLVHAEQGFGDTLQFLRYVPLVRERGARVILEVQPALIPLLNSSGYSDPIAAGTPLPPFDLQVPLMNLPIALKSTADTIPHDVPYLTADAARVAAWRSRLAGPGGFRVGIAWQGNASYIFDRSRSIPLAQFAPLAEVPGVRLISLQKNEGAEQIAAVAERFTVEELGPDFDAAGGAFMDTAAVMRKLDLIITSDTAIAHLAGALGVPVWVAVSFAPDWRFHLQREDSPWYPTMRLFRQPTLGAWPEVFEQIAKALAQTADGSSPK